MLSEQLRVEIQRNIAASLAEDIGTGDLTARLIAPDTEARGRVITREDAVLCGTAWFDAAFAALTALYGRDARGTITGVTLLGEVGLGSVKAGYEAKEMVAWARKHGIPSTIHTGGPSIPGSGLIDKDVVLEADADVIGHINGGHTALPEAHVCELCEKSSRAIEIVHNGNEKVAIAAAQAAMQLKCPHRVILGTDGPAGSGVQPLGMLRMWALLSSLGGIPAELVYCFATGNTAKLRKLNSGLIEIGRDADFVFMDRAQHTAGKTLLESVQLGDIPGIGMVMIDGIVRCGRSRNTPPAMEVPVVVAGHG